MATVLAVLKIAGLVLLGILVLVLLLLAMVLFVPIRFRIDAVIPDTLIEKGWVERIKKEAFGNAQFHWLLHAVRGAFAYPADEAFTVKVLWFTLIGKKDHAEEPSISADPSIPSTGSGTVSGSADDESSVLDIPKKEETPKEKVISERAKAAVPEPVEGVGGRTKPKAKQTKREGSDDPGPTIPRFLAKVFEILYFILTKPYEVFWKLQYTISSVCDRIGDVRGFMDSALFDRAKKVVLKQTFRLLRGIKPKKCNVRVLAGTGDPALTADILAVFSTLYPLFGGGIRMEPDFDRGIIGLDAHLKGRITLFRILTCAGIVYFNKDVRRAYQKARRILRR